MARVAVLVNPTNATTASSLFTDVEDAARILGLKIDFFNASTSLEIEMVFTALAREHPDAIFIAPEPFFTDRRVQLANLAARNALPTSFSVRENVEAGGLMSYGETFPTCIAMSAPIAAVSSRAPSLRTCLLSSQPSSSWSSTIQTARMLGLDVPPSLLAIADEVIE